MGKVDVVIIGGGIIGGAIAYELCKYNLDILVLEKNAFLADETSKGNSGIIHGGFDPKPHKIMAKLNVLGNKIWRTQIFQDLDFPHIQADSLVIAFNEQEMEHIQILYDRGIENKVSPKCMKILTKEETLDKEPNLNKELYGALLCTSSWIIEPVKATLAFFGAAANNGVQIRKSSKVTNINPVDGGFDITINNKTQVFAQNIINAAGHYADVIAQMAGFNDFKLKTRRGEYRILSKTESGVVNSICFMAPTLYGKGVIVAPMLDGRIMVGPTTEENVPKDETRIVTRAKYEHIGRVGTQLVPNLKLDKTELIWAGSRSIDVDTNDFIIRYASGNKHFINVVGMQSPGLSSAPAIAIKISQLLKNNGIELTLSKNYKPKFKVMW